MLTDYNKGILEFAQKWRTGTISDQEMDMLNNWFYALEGVPLGCPEEVAVDKLEKRLHQQLWKLFKKQDGEDRPPHPWH